MGCPIKVKLINDLIDKGAINSKEEVINLAKFKDLNESYTKLANGEYDVNTYGKDLFTVEDISVKGRSITKIIPNTTVLDLMTDVVEDSKVEETVNEEVIIDKKNITDLLDESADNFLYTVEESVQTETTDPNINSKILFDNQDRTFTAKEVLDNIKLNYSGLNEGVIALIDKLLPKLYTTNSKIKFVSEATLSNTNDVMEYNPITNEVLISKDRLEKYNTETVIASFLHEVIHSTVIKAYKNPVTMEEKMFKSFIDDIFAKYKDTADFKEQGFDNEMEFMAKIMTDSEFQDKIKNTESLWDRIVDYIRTLIGLPKNSEYNNIIEEITKVIEESNYVGGINDMLYQSRAERNYYDISSTEKRQKKVLDGIKDNLEESVRRYDNLIKKLKDPSKLSKYSDKLKDIFDNLENFDDTQEWLAISTFVGQLSRNINNLKESFNKVDITADDIEKTVNLYDKYLTSHSLIEEISDFVSKAKADEHFSISREDIIKLQNDLSIAKGEYDALKKDIQSMKEKFATNLLNNRKYASEVLHKWEIKLGKKYNTLGLKENKTNWVGRQMNTIYKEEIDADVKENANKLVNNVDYDITKLTGLFVSGISTNSKLIKIMQNLVNEVRGNIIKTIRNKDFELKPIFDKFVKAKGNSSPSVMNKNILEYDKDGTAYLKGDYKLEFRELYQTKLKDYNAEKIAVESKFGIASSEYQKLYIDSEFKNWVDNNTITISDEMGNEYKRPIDKWKNDLSKLPIEDREVIEAFRKISQDSNKSTFKIQSLISKPLFGGRYYSLPVATKTDLERVLEKQVVGTIKDKWYDLTKVRPDDIGYEIINTDLAGKPIYNVKIHYRGKLDPSQQSLDVFTLYRLEARNGISFEEKHNAETNVNMLVDISKHKEYYRSTGTRVPFLNININRNKEATKKGEESNTYKRMISLMESNIYDILYKDAGKTGKIDNNKAVALAIGWTAKVGLWMAGVAGSVNVLNGKAQLFLETIAGTSITRRSLGVAEKNYFKDIKANMQDLTNPIKTSFTNQVNEMFDTFGTISVKVEQAFIRNTLAKSVLDTQSLQFVQESGEHWMQSTLTQGVLEDIKVMDKNNNFLTKTGEITTEENGASMLDMLFKNPITEQLELNPKVVYTTRSIGVKYNEGGKEIVTSLIKLKILQTMGNYDKNMQPEAMRHAQYKMLMTFRRYFVELGINRFRGFSRVDIASKDLFDEEKFYSEEEQEYIEGMYTTTIRYIIPIIKSLNYKLVSTNWKELSDYEKSNIHKTIVEVAITSAVLPAIGALLAALKGDDDDERIWFLMLINRRLQSELSSFRSLSEQYKILESPIPSMRMLENATRVIGDIAQPLNWNERDSKDRLKIIKDFKKITPIINSTNSTYKQKYQYLIYMTN